MKARVAIVKGKNRKENITNALDLLKKDVFDSIRKKGKEALFVKVNTLDSEIPDSCTHPEALEAVLEYFYEDFRKVIVGDNSSCFMQGPNIYEHLKKKFENIQYILDCLKEGIGTSEVDMIKHGFYDLSDISKKFEMSSTIKYQTMEESMFPKVNADLIKAVITNSHPHRMVAKLLRMMLRNG